MAVYSCSMGYNEIETMNNCVRYRVQRKSRNKKKKQRHYGSVVALTWMELAPCVSVKREREGKSKTYREKIASHKLIEGADIMNTWISSRLHPNNIMIVSVYIYNKFFFCGPALHDSPLMRYRWLRFDLLLMRFQRSIRAVHLPADSARRKIVHS